MYKYALNNRSARSALLLGASIAACFVAPAFAQQDNGVETVVVTGSLLSRADVETPSPVTILTSQDIQASGLTSTADVLRSLAQDNSGSIPTAFSGGFAAGRLGRRASRSDGELDPGSDQRPPHGELSVG